MSKIVLNIPVVLGTGRHGRRSEHVAQFLSARAMEYGFHAPLVDVRSFLFGATVPSWDEDARAEPWRRIAGEANGFIIVIPEYNHGYPGELKILLDSAFKEYAKKPVGLCGVSGGPMGGGRAIENILPVIREFQLIPTFTTLYFPFADKIDLSAWGKDEKNAARLKDMFDEIRWYGETLAAAKERSSGG